jgi:DNA-binding MarR family transcriptional regulator
MVAVQILQDAAFDNRLRGGVHYHVLAHLLTAIDDKTGVVGKPMDDPAVIAKMIPVSQSTVYRILDELDKLGYVTWKRIQGRSPSVLKVVLPAASA